MGISRRQFFRGFTGREGPGRQLRRAAAIDAYVRTNLLPYDFSLTDEQVEHLLQAVRSELTPGEGSEFSSEERRRMSAIAQEIIQTWREEYLKAEEKRREAILLACEFLHTETTPGCLERMRNRFQIPASKSLQNEIERLATSWVFGLPNARLASLNAVELKELVFSEMNSWCRTDSG
jgi:hypothetical protein